MEDKWDLEASSCHSSLYSLLTCKLQLISGVEMLMILLLFVGIGYLMGKSSKRKKPKLIISEDEARTITSSQSSENIFSQDESEDWNSKELKKCQSCIFDEYLSCKIKTLKDKEKEDIQIKIPEVKDSFNNIKITLKCPKMYQDKIDEKSIGDSIEKFYKYFENGKCNQNFEIINKIGKGRNSVVFKAKHLLDGQFYAIKVIKLHVGIKENIREQKMFREVFSMSKLLSKFLLRYYSSWIELDHPHLNPAKQEHSHKFCDLNVPEEPYFTFYLVIQTELSIGISLQDWLQNSKRKIDSSINFRIFKQLLKGVQCIHSNNFIHRDLKPTNIFLNKDSKNLSVKIADFGLAIIAKPESEQGDSSKHKNGVLPRNRSIDVISIHYRAPELLTQECSQKMDIYALGLILFELFFEGSPLEKEFYFNQLNAHHILPERFESENRNISKIILMLTEPDPIVRPDIFAVMKHDFLQTWKDEAIIR
ncbi:EIF2AK2_2 [Blepharisma stoltei]|uniref:Protein kinase domain-containing protein n=1 Tax=Blepharisma stoltei TaxID=1481888 RepID=A0AAU9JCY4_9CILI|nr:unnamed protein product [Blepharisma stoltei]